DAAQRASELANSDRPVHQAELDRIERDLTKLGETRDRYLAAFERGTLPEDACGERLRALQHQQSQLEARADELRERLANTAPAPIDTDGADRLRDLIATGLPSSTPAARKHILEQLIEKIEIRGRDWIQP